MCRPCKAARGEGVRAKPVIKAPPVAEADVMTDDLDSEAQALTVIEAAPTHSLRNTIAQWRLHRIRNPKWTTARIAEEMGMAKGSLYHSISKARKKGILVLKELDDQIEHVLIPKTVENIGHYLEQGDKEMTIQAAKGFGIFKSGSAATSDGTATVIGIKIELPKPNEAAAAGVTDPGNVMGVGKYTDIIDVEAEEPAE